MTDYRVYFLDDNGHILRGEVLERETDAQAIEAVAQMIDGLDMELGERGRLVERFKAKTNPKP